MMQKTFLVTFILSLILSACGNKNSGGKGGGGSQKTPEKTTENPWSGIDRGTPADENTLWERTLSFSDGFVARYDGSDSGGEELVCRREIMVNEDGGESLYEVCMTLEDDPYFVALVNNAFVWNPLMFERFSTDLSCYSWQKNSAREMADCTTVFNAIGGEDFFCVAGLVNGDKALKCSDGWAVVVNGRDEDPKTVCRVFSSDGTGRCLAAFKEGTEDGDLILDMQQTSWEGYQSDQENSRQFGVGDSGQPMVLQDVPPGAVLSYASEDEEICRVDDDDSDGGIGTVMISEGVSASSTCRIYLTVEAEGYADRVLFVDIPILQQNDIEWPNYVRLNNYFYPGERLQSQPIVSSSGTVENSYISLDESICTVDENTGEVTAVDTGECVIRLMVSAPEYLDVVLERSIPVDELAELTGTISWSDFDALDSTVATAQVGGTSVLGAPQVQAMDGDGTPVTSLTLSIEYTAGDCAYSFDGTNHNIEFTGVAECVITISTESPSVRGVEKIVEEFRYTPPLGSFTLNWTGYASGANSAEYGPSAPVLDTPSTTPGSLGAVLAYSASGGGCEVDAISGVLTIVGADNTTAGSERSCLVTLTANKDGYQEQRQEHTVTIGKKPQADLSATNPYGGVTSLQNGATLEIVNPPSGGIGDVIYGLSSGTCSVVGDNGDVTAEASTGNCVVKAWWTGDDNNAASAEVDIATIAMVAGSGTDPIWSSTPYGSNPSVGGAAVALANNAITNVAAGAGALEYKSGTLEVCSVASNGEVSGVAAGVDACIVQARFVGDATHGASSWVDSSAITVEKGTHPVLTGSNYYGTTPEVPSNGTLALVTPPEGHGVATYTVKSGSGNYCAVERSTGEVSGVAKTTNANDCVIQVAFDGGNDYNALTATDLQAIVVTDGVQELTITDPYGTPPLGMAVGDTLALSNPPVSAQGGAISYHVATDSTQQCDVGTNGTVTALAPGSCTIEFDVAGVSGYLPVSNRELAIILVGEGSFSFAWDPRKDGVDYRVGNEAMIAEVNVGSTGVTPRYIVADAGDTGCAFKGTSGNEAITLTFTSHGLCTLRASATKEHYREWSEERSIRVKPGEIDITVGAFGNSETLVVGAENPLAPTGTGTPDPSDARVYWELVRGERDCILVNSQTGAVRARAVDVDATTECSLHLVAEKVHYRSYRSDPVSIPLEEGNMGDMIDPVYGDGASTNLPVRRELELVAAPRAVSGLDVSVESIVATGTDSGDTSKADVCSVDADGNVQAGTSGFATDKCTVTFTLMATGYADQTVELVLTLVENSLVFSRIPTLSYSGSELQVGGAALSISGSLPNVDESGTPASINWVYVAEGQDAGGSPKTGVCIVVGSGAVNAGEKAAVGDNCTVKAIGTAAGHIDMVVRSGALAIIPGDLLFGSDTNKASYGSSLNIGSRLEPAIPGTDDNSVDVTWGGWRVEGVDPDNSNAAKGDVCSVDTEGVVTEGSAAVVGNVCNVYAVASAPNYNDSDEYQVGEITIAARAMFGAITGPVYTESLALRGLPIEVTTAPDISGVNAEITWTYRAVAERNSSVHTPVSDICTVDSNNGTVSVGDDAEFEDTCKIIAIADAPGYTQKVAGGDEVTELVVHDTFVALNWNGINENFYVGGGTDIVRPTTVPATSDANITITKVSGDCIWDNYSEINFSGLTDCILRVTATKEHYLPITKYYRISPLPGDLYTIWGSYGAVRVGAERAGPTGLQVSPSDTTKTFSLAEGSSGCDVNRDTGAVTGTAPGTDNCKIKLSLSRKSYHDKERIYTISVGFGTQTLSWNNAYGSSPGLVTHDGRTLLPLNPIPTGQGELLYRVLPAHNSLCEVLDDGTGEIRMKGVVNGNDSCSVQAQFVGNTNYDSSPWTIIGSITLTSAQITGVSWPSFDLTGTVGVEKVLPEVTGHTSGVHDVDYLKMSGTGCSLSGRTLTFTGTGDCKVRAQITRDGYFNLDMDRIIVVSAGTLTVSNWGTYSTVTVGTSATAAPAVTSVPTGLDKVYTLGTGSIGCGVDRDTGAVTGTASGTDNCKIKLVVSKNGYSDKENVYSISVQQGTLTSVSWGGYSSTTATYGSPAPTKQNPSSTPAATWVYTTDSASTICTVDRDSGVLTINGAGSCEVTATPSLAHYQTHSGVTRTVTISEATQSPPSGFSDHYGMNPSVAVGTTLDTSGTDPVNSISDGGGLEYNVKSGSCTVVAGTGQVEGVSTDADCVIEARFAAVDDKYTASGYVDVATITVTNGSQSYTWSQSNDSTAFGTELVLAALTALPDGAEAFYEIASDGNSAGCDWKGENGADARTLTFTDDGSCQVSARVTRDHYNDWTSSPLVTITVTPLSWTSVPAWGGYNSGGNQLTYGTGPHNPDTPGSTPGADWTYSTDDDGSVCVVASNGGALTINGAGSCSVTATPDKAGYGTHGGITVAVTISEAAQSPPSGFSDHYGMNPSVAVGTTLDTSGTDPVNSISEGGGLEYNVKSGSCTVVAGTGEVEGVSTDADCVIEARFAAVDDKYTASGYVDVATIAVTSGSQSYTWSQSNDSTAFGTELALAALTALPDGAEAFYEIASDGNSAGCDWKGENGADARTLTFTDDGSCQVGVRVTRDHYNDWTSSPLVTITVTPLSWTMGPAWDGYNSGGNQLTYGTGPHNPDTPGSTPGADWTYSTDDDGSVCVVASNGGALTINGAGSCSVTATPDKAGYGTHGGITVAVTISEAAQSPPSGFSDHYGMNPSVAVGTTLDTSGTDPVNSISEGGGLEYNVKSGSCTVVAGTGQVEGVSTDADCVIEARFAAVDDKYTASGYVDVATITVTNGSQSYTWSQSNDSTAFGTELVLAALTALPDGAEAFYEIASDGNSAGCDWKGENGADARTLTFTDDGSCQVSARVTRDHYNDWTSSPLVTITVTPLSWTMGPAWDGYNSGGNQLTYGTGPHNPDTPGSTPGADWTYSTDDDGSVCVVASNGGALTINGAGSCSVTATPDKAGYGTHGGITVDVTIGRASQTEPSWSDPYGANPEVIFESTLSLDTGRTVDVGEGDLIYQVASSSQEYCEVNSSTGEVTPLVAGVERICTIEAQFAGNANHLPSPWGTIASTINIRKASFSGLGWNPPSTAIRGETIFLPGVTGSPGTNNLTYNKIQGNCVVTGATLFLSGLGNCIVTVTVAKPGYNSWTSDPNTISVSSPVNPLNFISIPSLSSNSNHLIMGNSPQSVQFDALPAADTGGSAVTWTLSVQGFESDDVTQKDGVCALASADTAHADHRKVTPGSSAAPGDVCVVIAVGSATGHSDYHLVPVRLTVSGQLAFSWRTWIPRYSYEGYTLSTRFSNIFVWPGAVVSLNTAPTGGYQDENGVAVTWSNWTISVDTNDNNVDNLCSIDTNGTVTISSDPDARDGVCHVEATASADGYLDETVSITYVEVYATDPQAAPDTHVGTSGMPYTDNDNNPPEGLVVGHSRDDYRRLMIVRGASGGGGHGSLEYRSLYPNTCSVIYGTGQVNAVAYGLCTVQVRWGGTAPLVPGSGETTAYAHSDWVTIWSFVVRKLQAAPDTNLDNAYTGRTLTTDGSSVDIVNIPSGGDNSGTGYGILEYDAKNQANICTVDSDGTVTPGSSTGGTCKIRARWSGNAEYGPSSWEVIWTTTIQ